MNKKKTVITAVVLSLVVLVGGLLAYFTDAKSKTNTFTIGNVKIELTEPAWVPASGLNLTPNAVVAKDPTVKVTGGNDAYVFLKVEVPENTDDTTEGYQPLFTYAPNAKWTDITPEGTVDGTKIYVYADGAENGMKKLSKNAVTDPLFTQVTLANITSSISGNQDIVVTAYGIQADNLGSATTPAAVWNLVKDTAATEGV